MKQKLQGETIPAPDALPDDVVISPDTQRKERLPPSQSRTKKWPVLDAHGAPTISMEDWKLEITGLVRTPLSFDWKTFRDLPRIKVFADMHCVTQWSRLGNLWEGVSTRELTDRAGVLDQARFVIMHNFFSNYRFGRKPPKECKNVKNQYYPPTYKYTRISNLILL